MSDDAKKAKPNADAAVVVTDDNGDPRITAPKAVRAIMTQQEWYAGLSDRVKIKALERAVSMSYDAMTDTDMELAYSLISDLLVGSKFAWGGKETYDPAEDAQSDDGELID